MVRSGKSADHWIVSSFAKTNGGDWKLHRDDGTRKACAIDKREKFGGRPPFPGTQGEAVSGLTHRENASAVACPEERGHAKLYRSFFFASDGFALIDYVAGAVSYGNTCERFY